LVLGFRQIFKPGPNVNLGGLPGCWLLMGLVLLVKREDGLFQYKIILFFFFAIIIKKSTLADPG
jgi:hypothetical protein